MSNPGFVKFYTRSKKTLKLIKTMKFYLIFIIFITFILSSIGNDHPIKNGQLQERNQTIQTLINDI